MIEREFHVDSAKIVGYLLNPNHPKGRTKASFFTSFGFNRDKWRDFAGALIVSAREGTVVDERSTDFGEKIVIVGNLPTADGRNPLVKTVWISVSGDNRWRLVTAYPEKS